MLETIIGVAPDIISAIGDLFDSSDESSDAPGALASTLGKAAARFIPDAEEDDVAEVLIALGEAGEMLKAAGVALKKANPPTDSEE